MRGATGNAKILARAQGAGDGKTQAMDHGFQRHALVRCVPLGLLGHPRHMDESTTHLRMFSRKQVRKPIENLVADEAAGAQ